MPRATPPAPSGERRGAIVSPTGNRREFTIVREALVKDGRYKELVLQRLHFDDGAVQLRFALLRG
jgi:hypothetical protein